MTLLASSTGPSSRPSVERPLAQYQYDSSFFAYTSASNQASAERVVRILRDWFPQVHSVADFGCGQGVWLQAWQNAGVTDVQGCDGDYVDPKGLRIAAHHFRAVDLAQPVDLGRRFDLVQCVEVAEHLPEASSTTLLRSLVSHADILLFSAAPPGQGGEHHVNERPYAWWRDLLAAEGFVPYDCIRPLLRGDPAIQVWYQYNLLLYAKEGTQLPDAVQRTRIAAGQEIVDISPLKYRLRKAIVRRLPPAVADRLARYKARLAR